MDFEIIEKQKWGGINCAGALILLSAVLFGLKDNSGWLWTLITFLFTILALLGNPGPMFGINRANKPDAGDRK